MPLYLSHESITDLHVDAIVNSTNPKLLPGGGVCGAIYKAAGEKELYEACRPLAPILTGQAVITPGFRLPAKWIIHTNGPIYERHTPEVSRQLLASCYINSLELALKKRLKSVAFPLISGGIYGYPPAPALQVALETIQNWLSAGDDRRDEMDVYMILYKETKPRIDRNLSRELEDYISETYSLSDRFESLSGQSVFVPGSKSRREKSQAPGFPRQEAPAVNIPLPDNRYPLEEEGSFTESVCFPAMPSAASPQSLDQKMQHLEKPFSQKLLELIDQKGRTDVDVYKRANLDRKLFSKIRSGKNGYTPRKLTILALAISLELSLDETEDLLRRAGYALSPSSLMDVIIEFFITEERYNIYEINEVLFQYHQPQLGG